MSEQDTGTTGWLGRIRRWLWLDRTQGTDRRETSRGFYPGGMPIYTNRKPVGLRFLLVVTALGIAIGLVLISVRDAQAWLEVVADGYGSAAPSVGVVDR